MSSSRPARALRGLTVPAVALLVMALLPATFTVAAAPPEWRLEAESFSTASTGARFSDANASGGAAWNIWTNGYIQTSFTAATSGAKQFDVVARGDVAAGVWPTMRLSVDGVAFAETTVSSSTYRTYSATLSSVGAGSHTLKIEFTNDAIVSGQDRNLKVDVASVIPAGVEEWRQECEAMFHSTGGSQSDSTASGGQSWNLWANGYAETTTMEADTSGTKHVVVYARGNSAGGVWPLMRISVDGVQLVTHSVNTTTWAPYVTLATLSKGMHTLRIEFTNDQIIGTEDRNLKIDVATLIPVANEWRQEAEAFTTRSTSTGIATSSTVASGGSYWNLHSNGYIEHAMTAASAGRKQIRIVARGYPYAGVYPLLRVWVAGTLVTTLTVDSQSFTQYVVPATTTYGTNLLRLEFTNNAGGSGGEDRNVHLDVATLVGDNAFPSVRSIPGPPSNAYVPAQPTLMAVYDDPDGDAGRVDFEVNVNATGTLAASGSSSQTDAGDLATWTPAALVNGTTYKWRARAFDGAASGAAWTAYRLFTVDSVAPVAPSVSSTTFAANAWSGTDATTGSFTFSPGTSSDVVGYKYGLDASPPTTDTTSTSVTLTPGEGPHHLYVQSVDRAGNLSPVTDYAFNVGSGAVMSPRPGNVTAKRFVLRTTANPSLTGVTYQWRRSATDAWAAIPAADVTVGGAAVTWPVALAAGSHADLTWDVSATVAGVDGPFEVRAAYNTGATTAGTRAELDQRTGGAASAAVGPGTVNLLTGNFAVSSTDVRASAFGANLVVSRTHSSRDPNADATGPFGPGWSSGVSVGEAVAFYKGLTVSGNLRTVTLVDGSTLGFTAASTTSFTPEPGMESLTLTRTAGAATPADQTDDVYELRESGGHKAVFAWRSTGFVPTSVTDPANAYTTSFTYETAGGVTRVARVLAPVPSGVSCAAPDTTRGCRSLVFDYAPSTTAIPGPAGGDYPDRLRAVRLVAWNPATSAMAAVELARYSYLPGGRLLAAWNPALPAFKTTYAYDTAGRLTSVTPPAEEPWSFAYTTLPNDPDGGRLKSVSRSALAAGTATTTVVYRVPVSGTGAPADLSATQLARWAQKAVPVEGTAVFPPTQVPDGNQATGVLPTSYERARVHYLDVAGREVNTLTPGGHVAVAEYDEYGNVVRELTPGNRARALNASGSDTAAQEAALAMRYSTLRTYAAQGQQLVDELGPEQRVALSSGVTDSLGRAWPAGSLVRARAHTTVAYDEGAPLGGPYHLPTTTRISARIADTTTDADTRTTTLGYDWDLRRPTSQAIDPAGLNLVSRASYDSATGVLTKETRPSGTAAQDTAATSVYSYYTAGAHPAYGECGARPEWANLLCRVDLAAQPAVTAERPAIPAKVVQYDYHLAPTTTVEKVGTTTVRTMTVQYDSAHRPYRTSMTGTGTPLQTVETHYDAANGLATEIRALDGTGAVTARVTRAFDSLGRLTSYTDADGNTSTTTYDLASRVVTTNDGKATQTRYYDEGTERRGVLSRLVDSAAGTFTATYDADGAQTSITLPNGLVRTITLDEAGTPTGMTYAKSGSTWLSFDATPTIHAQWAAASSSGLSSQAFSYDAAGRLTKVADTVNGAGCTLREYAFDADSNRTTSVTRQPDSEGQCDSAAAGSTTSYGYDTASRMTTAEYAYDALGRTTSLPERDASGLDLDATYYVNDLAHTVTQQDGIAASWTLDPTQRRFRARTQGTVTKVNHYAGDGDSPAWIDEGGGAWTRYVAGIDGALAAVQDSAGTVVLQLVNLRGDVVATSSIATGATGPSATYESTEFGTPRDGTIRRYAWQGGTQRAADPTGVTLMGVRLYNPSTGRFLQVDPVKGGNANDYDYGHADPVNHFDPTGEVNSRCSAWSSICRRYDSFGTDNLAYKVFFWMSAHEISELQKENRKSNQWWHALNTHGLNFTTDDCTFPGNIMNSIYGNHWTEACRRHDFGYRNHGKIFANTSWWDKLTARATVDKKLYNDAVAACNRAYPSWSPYRYSCQVGAETVFYAVRAGGWIAW